MAFRPGVIDACRDWGLTVHESPGCRTRGQSDFAPRGVLFHHDVIPDAPGTGDTVPRIIIVGRGASPTAPALPGPLANFWLETDGDVHVAACGTANHAGAGSWPGIGANDNDLSWGVEMNNLGTPADPWPRVQIEAAWRLGAALADFSGFPVGRVIGHKEWAPDRKIDPHSLDMHEFRRHVAAQTKGGFLVGADAEMVRDAIATQGQLTRETIVNQAKLDRRAALEREKRTRELNGQNSDDVVDAIEALDNEP
jgi:hypothetical protein